LAIYTRKRIKFPESQLLLVWQRLLGRKLITEEGKQVRMIYSGRINANNGPDFRDAVMVVNESDTVKGDVEIHVKSSDWYRHGHQYDHEYNKVILHVVAQHDAKSATLTQNGKSVPVVCLTHKSWHQAYLIPYHQLPCCQITKHKDRQALWKLLDIAGEERFGQKAAHFMASLQSENGGQVFFQGIMRALGYSNNSKSFEELACRATLSFMEGMIPAGDLSLKQAWLLGLAGLLPSQRKGGGLYIGNGVMELERIWRLVGKGAEAMRESDWHLSHVYPNNSPVRRIVAQSHILQRYREEGLLEGMLRQVRKASMIDGYRLLEEGLIVSGSGYWQYHFDFGYGSKTRRSALLGNGKAAEMVINIILPFAFSWGEMTGEPELKDKAITLYNYYPKLAENGITRHMIKQLCIEDTSGLTACRQQGLIHIFRDYCREGNCDRCYLVN